MGSSPTGDNTPRQCFNAAKSWQLGWFSDKTAELAPAKEAWLGQVVATIDYKEADPNQFVLLKVGPYYVELNIAEDMNEGSREEVNSVAITELLPTDFSDLKGAVNQFQTSFEIEKFSGDSPLVVDLCSFQSSKHPIYAEISIWVKDGKQTSKCPGGKPLEPIEYLTNLVATGEGSGVKNYLASYEDCANECKIRSKWGCASFSYDLTDPNRMCTFGKDSMSLEKVECPEGEVCTKWGKLITGKTYGVPKDLTYIKGGGAACTDSGAKKDVASFEGCKAACVETDGCKSFSIRDTNKECSLCTKEKPAYKSVTGCALPDCVVEWGSVL